VEEWMLFDLFNSFGSTAQSLFGTLLQQLQTMKMRNTAKEKKVHSHPSQQIGGLRRENVGRELWLAFHHSLIEFTVNLALEGFLSNIMQ
jgi:hypothetical protein